MDEKVTSNEQQAKSKKQRAKTSASHWMTQLWSENLRTDTGGRDGGRVLLVNML